MRISDCVGCKTLSCLDINSKAYRIPAINVDPASISVVLVSECAPEEAKDDYYAGNGSLFEKTTVHAFQEAGARVSSVQDILKLGVYLTTAVKCGKTGYAIDSATVDLCSRLLEKEISFFPNVKAYLLMGDVAIRAFNSISKRVEHRRAVPAGSTYKVRKEEYCHFRGARVFPTYLQAGPAYYIEESKREMIAEDIAAALAAASRK